MHTDQILKDISIREKNFNGNIDVVNLSCNPEEKNDNGLFFNLKDSISYALKAKINGAQCMVVSKLLPVKIPQIVVPSVRKAMSYGAARYYDYRPEDFTIIGVTGTNGKTTTTHIVHQLFDKMCLKSALIGTEGIHFDGYHINAKMTTPDPIDLFKILSYCKKQNVRYVVMEVSAHASALDKVAPIKYDVMMLTNITQDHLDFFHNMQNYAEQKYKLVTPTRCKKAILNTDDERLNSHFSRMGTHKISIGKSWLSDYQILLHQLSAEESQIGLIHLDEAYNFHTNLIGEYNVYNLVSALAICTELGFSLKDMIKIVKNTDFVVPGRMQKIHLKNGATAVVDYAHTPDGVYQFLSTLKSLTQGQLIGVFGCGGDRDRDKRHIMGDIASRICDKVVVTSDNPRSEKPESIIKDIVSGIKSTNFEQITDRKQAIAKAIKMSKAGDVVAIFGKGAEKTQEINGKKINMCDIDTVNQCNVR